MKGVIIKVYTESSILFPHHKNEARKRINPIPFRSKAPTGRTRGYDRRAELLRYAHKLRSANGKLSQWPPYKSVPKQPKIQQKWRWSLSLNQIGMSYPRLFHRTSRQGRYEHIVAEDYNQNEESCSPEKMNRTKGKSNERRNSHFCAKLKCFIKELSCFWDCNGRHR